MPDVSKPSVPPDPHGRRWMCFVDGENLAIRGRKVAEGNAVALVGGPHYQRDVFLWFPGIRGTDLVINCHLPLQPRAIRAFYYTSVRGDDPMLGSVEDRLRDLGFTPEVFKKRGEKGKGVDITLACGLLSNAFRGNYDVAILVAGDSDYVSLVEEVKRLGKVVCVGFFRDEGLGRELFLAADGFTDIGRLIEQWK